jgi:putative transposase
VKRKSYGGKYKAKVALEVIKSQKTVSQIASEFDVHPNQATQWKKKVLEELPNIFSRKRKREQRASEELQEELYSQIGKLKVELDWLKKKTGLVG